MPGPDPDPVTRLLAGASGGDAGAVERLFPIIYDELRRLADRYLGDQRPGHTLQPTALVHEAFLRLAGAGTSCEDRGHFFAVAATAMRQVLVNHAKARGSAKRGGGAARTPLVDSLALLEERAIDLVALDEALERLAHLDPEQAHVVELRFFAGLTVDETAAAVGRPVRSVERDWSVARRWLRAELERGTTP